jgi:hypothetical protein
MHGDVYAKIAGNGEADQHDEKTISHARPP